MSFQALIASGENALVERFSAALSDIGVQVESVPETEPAVSLLNRKKFEAVLLDCDLDGGLDLVESVRTAPGNERSLVMAFVTGTPALRGATQRGANFVLPKPINWEVAKRTLRAAHTMIIRERRRSIREKVRFAATINFEQQHMSGMVTDISEGGLALKLPADIPLGTSADVHFKFSSHSAAVSCQGVIAWANKGLIGLEFSYVDPKSSRAIVKWLMCHAPRRVNKLRTQNHSNEALSWGF